MGVRVTQHLTVPSCPLPAWGSPSFCPAPPAQPLWGPNAVPRMVPAKGSALVLQDDLGCGKRKRWREAGVGGDRDDDTPQLHFYLETLEKVFLSGHEFCFTDEQNYPFWYSPAPLDNDEETDVN